METDKSTVYFIGRDSPETIHLLILFCHLLSDSTPLRQRIQFNIDIYI